MDLLKIFLDNLGKAFSIAEKLLSKYPNTINIAIVLIPGIAGVIWKIICTLIDEYHLKKFSVTSRPQEISEEEFYYHIHNYIKTRLKSDEGKKYTFDRFIKNIIKKGKKQYHIILGEAGTGKSTFLINLYYRCSRKLKKRYCTVYISLKSKKALQQIVKIEEQKKTILLLDAFDESSKANENAKEFLKEIELLTSNFAKVIISSRNNFFDAESEVPEKVQLNRILLLNVEKYNKFYVEPFNMLDVQQYLVKKYKIHLWKYLKALRVVWRCGDIICRPLIISYIDLLIEGDNDYKNMTEVYDKIVKNWIEREANYITQQDKAFSVEEIEEKMFLAINEIAIYMYIHYPEEKEYSIKITNFKQIENADFLEKTDGKRSRSLFDRVDDKLIFAHKSLLEYFLALSFDRLDFRYEQHLNTLYKFLRESVGKNWEAKYAPLFLINYADESPEIVKYNENESYVEVRSNNVPTDRTFVEKMVRWYSAAFRLPVFLDTKIYERSKIEFVLHNGSQFYHVLMVADNDVEEIIDRIMYRIKNGVAWREAVNLKVITSLERNPVHN